MVNSGQYDHKLSEDIVNQALTAGGDGNEDWKSVIRPIKRELKVKLSEIGLFSDKKDMNIAMATADLSPEDILSRIEAEYNSLINTEEWPPAKNKVDPTAPPSQKQALTTADMGLRPNGKKTKGKPKFNKFNKNNKSKNNKFKGESSSKWKYQAPKDNEPKEKMVGSKKWMWCQKCNNNKGRWTLSHTTEDHKDDYQKKSSSNSNNSVDQPKPKATAVTTAEEPGETDLGVWCTALELNSNNYPPFSVIMMYILLGVCIGIFAINKSYKVFAAVSPHSSKAFTM